MQENREIAIKGSEEESERARTKPMMEQYGLTGDNGAHDDASKVGIKRDSEARLDWAQIAATMRKPMYVFDGRNILDATKLERLGFRVEAIGRASKKSQDLGIYE